MGTVVARAEGLLWRRTADRVLVVVSEGDAAAPVVLTGTAVALWDVVERAIPISEIVQELAQQYGEDPARIEGQVRSALDELRGLGVIELNDTA